MKSNNERLNEFNQKVAAAYNTIFSFKNNDSTIDLLQSLAFEALELVIDFENQPLAEELAETYEVLQGLRDVLRQKNNIFEQLEQFTIDRANNNDEAIKTLKQKCIDLIILKGDKKELENLKRSIDETLASAPNDKVKLMKARKDRKNFALKIQQKTQPYLQLLNASQKVETAQLQGSNNPKVSQGKLDPKIDSSVSGKKDPNKLPFTKRVQEAFENIFLTNKDEEHMTMLFALRDEANTPSENLNLSDDVYEEHMGNEYTQDILQKVAESMGAKPNLLSELKASTEGKERDALKEKCAQLFIPRGVKKGSDEYKHFLSQGRQMVENGLDAIEKGANKELRFEAGLKAIIADVINNKFDTKSFQFILTLIEEARKGQYVSSSGELIYPSLERMFTSNNSALDGTNLVIKVNELKSAIASGDEEKVTAAENEMVKLCAPLNASRATEAAENNPFVKLLRDQIPTQYNEKADKAAISRYIKEITKYSKDIEKLNNNVSELNKKIQNLNANGLLTNDRKSQLLGQTGQAIDSAKKLLQEATAAKDQAKAAKDVYDAKMAPLREGYANRMLDKPESKSFLSGFQNFVNKIRSPKNTVPTSNESELPRADDDVVSYSKQSDELIMANFKSEQSKLMSKIEAITKKGGNLETKRALMSRLENSLEEQLKYESSVQLQRQPIYQLTQEFAKLDEDIKEATADDQEQVTSEDIVALVKGLIKENKTLTSLDYLEEIDRDVDEIYASKLKEYLGTVPEENMNTAISLVGQLTEVFQDERAKLSQKVDELHQGLGAKVTELNAEIKKNQHDLEKAFEAASTPGAAREKIYGEIGRLQKNQYSLKQELNETLSKLDKRNAAESEPNAFKKDQNNNEEDPLKKVNPLDAIIKAQASWDKDLITKAINKMPSSGLASSDQTNKDRIVFRLVDLQQAQKNLTDKIKRLDEGDEADAKTGLIKEDPKIIQLEEEKVSIQMEIDYVEKLAKLNSRYVPFDHWKSSVIGKTSSIMQSHFEQQLKNPKNIKPLERGFTETPISSETMKKLLNTNVNSGWIGVIKSTISSMWSKLNVARLPLITKKYDIDNQSSVVVNLLVDKDKVINLTSQAEYDALKDEDKNEVAMEQAIMFMEKNPGKEAEISGKNTDLNGRITSAMNYLIDELPIKATKGIVVPVKVNGNASPSFEHWEGKKEYADRIQKLATKFETSHDQKKTAMQGFKERVSAVMGMQGSAKNNQVKESQHDEVINLMHQGDDMKSIHGVNENLDEDVTYNPVRPN